jgi:hypothetical protein
METDLMQEHVLLTPLESGGLMTVSLILKDPFLLPGFMVILGSPFCEAKLAAEVFDLNSHL